MISNEVKILVVCITNYYFSDVDLKNASLCFKKENKEPHLMENIIYNKLVTRVYNVNIGVVDSCVIHEDKKELKKYEVDFIADKGGPKFYIQCANYIPDDEKLNQETESLEKINVSFTKIFVSKYSNGILYVSSFDFLFKFMIHR